MPGREELPDTLGRSVSSFAFDRSLQTDVRETRTSW
jgi:hypothetical protein